MKKWLIILCGLFPVFAQAQTIITIAGNGSYTTTGDGGPATAAHVANTAFGCFDGAGNHYFGEGFGSTGPRIRMINTAGIINTVAGNGISGFGGDNGPATAAEISYPAVKVDSIGNIYIADYYNYRVRKVDFATGIIRTIAGNGTNSSTGDGGPATAATIFPNALCVDGEGNVFVSENAGNIRKIDASTGVISHVASTYALGMCFDGSGNLYLGLNVWVCKVDTSTGIIDTIAGTGTYLYNGDGIPATTANLRAYDVAIDATGNIYVADDLNNRIRKIDPAGIIHTVAGTGVAGFSGDGGLADTAKINDPEGVAIDPFCGNLYIDDHNNNRIRKIILSTAPPVITISPSPGNVACKNAIVTFYSTVTMGTSVSYQWLVNGTAVAGATNSTYAYTPNNADSVRCILVGVSRCSGATDTVSSNTVNMTVVNLTVPTISIAGITTALVGAVVTVTATVTNAGGIYNIKWFNNGLLFSTTTTPIVTYTKAAGTDNITARVISTACCCYDSITSSVLTIADTNTGIKTATGEQIYVYPNPANELLHIILPTGMQYREYRLQNIVGSILLCGTLKQGDNSISLHSLPVGVYVLEIINNEGERMITKVIKQ